MSSVLTIWQSIRPNGYTAPKQAEIESHLLSGNTVALISTKGIWEFACDKKEVSETVRNINEHCAALGGDQ